ncbi:hypothetical protein BD310DRAFT_832408, partial [Dichomitus squalens]
AVAFLYDSMITSGEEIRCFWGRKITGAAILFWLNKYMTVLDLVWNLATGLSISDKYHNQLCPCSCDLSARGDSAIQYLLFIVLAAFTSIRVYALRRSLTLCAITAILSLVPLGFNFANFGFGLTGENIVPFGCTDFDNAPIGLSKKFTIICRSCLIEADSLAIGATWFSLGLWYPTPHGGIIKRSIASVLLMDGTVYFLILAVLNTVDLALTLISVSIHSATETAQYLTVSVKGPHLRFYKRSFTTPISAILVSRFLLHLQAASLRAVGSIPSSQVSSLHLDCSLVFERLVGSLGASIVAEDYLVEDYDNGDDVERAEGQTETSKE